VDTYLALIQTAAVVVAMGGIIAALRIATVDRERADQRAVEDRADARAEAERRWTLDLLVALSRNLANPDAMDREESQRKGGERAALIQAIGPDRLPLCWRTFRHEVSEEEIRRIVDDPNEWDVGRCESEVYLLLQQVRDVGVRSSAGLVPPAGPGTNAPADGD